MKNIKIKEEHQKLIDKIAKHSLDAEWSDDTLIHFVTQYSMDDTTYFHEIKTRIAQAFESPVDITNLCFLIKYHYNLETICQALIQKRIDYSSYIEY